MDTHQSVEIDHFEREHIPPALELWNSTEHIGLSSADSPEALYRFLARNEGLSFCALHAGVVVGTVLCGTDGRRGYIHHLAVAERFRRYQTGSLMLSRSLEALAALGIAKCHAFVFRDNPYAELFWGARGWQLREDLLVYSRPIVGGG